MGGRGRGLSALFCGSALAFAPVAGIAATPAGTVITNIADIQYQQEGAAHTGRSNRVDVRVDELIRFTVTSAPTCVAASASVTVVGFRITNLGNGVEDFIPGRPVVSGGSNFAPTAVIADSNRNECYDSGTDQTIPPGGHTTPVAPGGSTVVYVTGTGGNGQGSVTLPVTSGTGGGASGTSIPGGGTGGTTAVIGEGGGTVTGVAGVSSTGLTAALVKSQSLRAADGSATPRIGAIVTYRIEGRFSGVGTATNAVIADAIPAGTSYVAGSLSLDGQKVSDGGGDDAGDFDGGRVSVRLGDVASPAVRTVSFQVRIN